MSILATGKETPSPTRAASEGEGAGRGMEERQVIELTPSRWVFLKQLDRMATDLLLPPRCVWCDVDLRHPGLIMLCQQCQNQLADSGSFCRGCGFYLSEGAAETSACARCRQAKFKFDSVIPMGPYRDVLRDAILEMKRPTGETLSVAVAQLFHHTRARPIEDFDADCLVPIPMYWGRRIWRGVNSSQLLGEELSRQIGIPCLAKALTRSRNTLPQKDLGHAERFRNVRDAFSLSGGYGLRDARVLVVDDIMTTGATCSEAAKTLKKGGAQAVGALVVGRAIVRQ